MARSLHQENQEVNTHDILLLHHLRNHWNYPILPRQHCIPRATHHYPASTLLVLNRSHVPLQKSIKSQTMSVWFATPIKVHNHSKPNTLFTECETQDTNQHVLVQRQTNCD
jgi:hypothetical protein